MSHEDTKFTKRVRLGVRLCIDQDHDFKPKTSSFPRRREPISGGGGTGQRSCRALGDVWRWVPAFAGKAKVGWQTALRPGAPSWRLRVFV